MDDVPDGGPCLADLVRDQHTDRGSAKAAHRRALCDQGSKQDAAKQSQQVRGKPRKGKAKARQGKGKGKTRPQLTKTKTKTKEMILVAIA